MKSQPVAKHKAERILTAFIHFHQFQRIETVLFSHKPKNPKGETFSIFCIFDRFEKFVKFLTGKAQAVSRPRGAVAGDTFPDVQRNRVSFHCSSSNTVYALYAGDQVVKTSRPGTTHGEALDNAGLVLINNEGCGLVQKVTEKQTLCNLVKGLIFIYIKGAQTHYQIISGA